MKPFFIFVTLLLLISCGTGDQPIVDLVSVDVQDDGSVKMEGRLDFRGDDLQQLGFCFDTMPDPRPNSTGNLNHTDGVLDGKKFIGDFPWFDAYQKYYFRAYAVTNEGDYVFSGQYVLDTIHAKHVKPLCTLKPDIFVIKDVIELSIFEAEKPEYSSSGYKFKARASSYTIDVNFGSYPINGIYTTTSNYPERGEVNVTIYGPVGGILDHGTKVYINQLGPEKWNMVICDGKYQWINSIKNFSANFDFPQ